MRTAEALLAGIVSLVIPGAGVVIMGNYLRGICIQASLLLLISLLCWSRWVFEPFGVVLSLVIVFFIYSLSPIMIFRSLKSGTAAPVKLLNVVYCLIFSFMSVVAAAGLFFAKKTALGVQLNFIPSESMAPTLVVGDFILVDTWQAYYRPPAVGDIITFKRKNNDALMVKRVIKEDRDERNQVSYFVQGDNRNFSTDSRSFGNIQLENTEGIVKLVLFSIDQQLAVRRDRLLIKP